MADTLPINFQVPNEGAIVSYNYTDFAEGTGITTFYGFVSTTDAGNDEHLTTDSSMFSTVIESVTSSGAGNAVHDADFDLNVFNMPQTLNGTAYVTFTFGGGSSSSNNNNVYANVTIRHWDGSTETDLVTDQSETIVVNNNNREKLVTMPLVIPKTNFKKGETLRLNITVTCERAPHAGTRYARLGTDPRNRDGTYITPSTDNTQTTQIKFNCPFDLNL